MSNALVSDSEDSLPVSFAIEVLALSYSASNARLMRLFPHLHTKEEKSLWGDQVVMISNLENALLDLKSLINKRGL